MGTEEEKGDALDKIGTFFRRQSTSIKQKYQETDFKKEASDLGKSISAGSKKAGTGIKRGFTQLGEKETVQKMKKSWFGFTTKVKGLFKSKDDVEESKEEKPKFRTGPDNFVDVKN